MIRFSPQRVKGVRLLGTGFLFSHPPTLSFLMERAKAFCEGTRQRRSMQSFSRKALVHSGPFGLAGNDVLITVQ